MKPLINIEEHNKIVATLNDKKVAIREAAELGEKTLESNKPKIPSFLCGNIKMLAIHNSDGSFSGFGMRLNDHEFRIEYPSSFGYFKFCQGETVLKSIAACVIKAFGPIPEEIINSVEVFK